MVNAKLGESDGLLLPYRIPDEGLDNFGVRAGEIFFFVDAGYLIAAVFNEVLQAFNSGALLVISSEVENLGYRAIFPALNLDLGAGYLLG